MSRQGPAALLSLKGRMANSASDNSVPGTIAAAETARATRPAGVAGVASQRRGVHDWATRAAAVSSLAAPPAFRSSTGRSKALAPVFAFARGGGGTRGGGQAAHGGRGGGRAPRGRGRGRGRPGGEKNSTAKKVPCPVCQEMHSVDNLKRSHYKEFTIISKAADGSMTESKRNFCVTVQSKERDRLVAQTKAARRPGGSQSLLFSAAPGNAFPNRIPSHFCWTSAEFNNQNYPFSC